MKRLLLAAALAIALASPAVAASKSVELSYSISDNGQILTIYSKKNPDSHLIKVAPNKEQWFRFQHGFAAYAVMPNSNVPMGLDSNSIIPDTSNVVATDAFQGGFLRDQTNALTLGALVVSNGAGPGIATTVNGTFNSTAPVLTTGTTSGLQVDANGALIVANGGKTYVELNQSDTSCHNLFTVAVRVVAVVNPGIAQTHPFSLFDDAGGCAGATLFGNAAAQGSTGPLMGPGQFIVFGVRTTTGLSMQWFTGQQVTGSIPYAQVQ